MKYSALRVVRAPETAGKRIDEGVDDIDVNEPEDAVVLLDEVPVVASDQLDVGVWGEAASGLVKNVLLVESVAVTMKSIDSGNGLKIGGESDSRETILDSELQTAGGVDVETVNEITKDVLYSLPS